MGVFDWQMPPDHLQLAGGELHLWRIDLEYFGKVSGPAGLLSSDEKARYSRLVSAEKRISFAAGRAALRLILAKYLNLLPRAIKFGYSDMGKPHLVNPLFGHHIRFNLSHSGRWMLLGICKDIEIGIDIEEVRPANLAWALDNLFSQEERGDLEKLAENERERAYIAAWTKKEAAAKADGTGLVGNSTKGGYFASTYEIQDPDHFTVKRDDGFWFLQMEPVPGYLAAIALSSAEMPPVKFYDFPHENENCNL